MTVVLADLLAMDLIKKHLRVDSADEDDLIELYAESALAWALWYCDNPLLATAGDIPASFKSALLLLIGHSYTNREAVVIGTSAEVLPMGVGPLLWSLRSLADSKPQEEYPCAPAISVIG
jgi:uncharacterized phage protein (predicted DNA packaging)